MQSLSAHLWVLNVHVAINQVGRAPNTEQNLAACIHHNMRHNAGLGKCLVIVVGVLLLLLLQCQHAQPLMSLVCCVFVSLPYPAPGSTCCSCQLALPGGVPLVAAPPLLPPTPARRCSGSATSYAEQAQYC
jgi:hypothetical protein